MSLWLRFEHGGVARFGRLDDEGRTVLVHEGDMFGCPVATAESVSLDDVQLLTPTSPSQFIGLWNNFRALATKLGQAIPEGPLYFLKAPGSVLEPGGVIRKPAAYDGRVIFEGELGIVIGRRLCNVGEEAAAEGIFGYTCVNDVTALDLLNKDPSFPQWTRAKSCDSFGPFGPVVATGLDWSQLVIRALINGRERQNYPAADMILPPARIVSMISRELTLLPGDIIACGTSIGALPMRPGSTVEVSIDGIGTLANTYEEERR